MPDLVRLPSLLITLKISVQNLGDVFRMIQENKLGKEFVASREPDVRDKFRDLVSRLGKSA